MPLTLRPAVVWVNVSVTRALAFTVNEIAVPTGGRFGLCSRAIVAALGPSRHFLWLWETCESFGADGGGAGLLCGAIVIAPVLVVGFPSPSVLVTVTLYVPAAP